MKFTEIATTHTYPNRIPEGYWIFNAPRPLAGSILNGGSLVWQGLFIEGIHYAAIDPTDPEARRWLEENHRLKAVLLRYVTEEEMIIWAEAKGYKVDIFTRPALWQAYFAECGRREVEIP